MTVETRTLYRNCSPTVPRQAPFSYQPVKQSAIPWCTTHDSEAAWIDPETDEPAVCHLDTVVVGEGGPEWQDCQISFGGPDHKWWRDA